jgi:ABC-type lipoprotein export system ATPase subunit
MSTVNALEISQLRFHYSGEPGRDVVRMDSLTLAPGEQVLLTGDSGSGKSTLLQLIAGLMNPSSGAIRVNGQNVHELRGAARDAFRGRSIGMVFQTFNLLVGFSAIENVLAALMFSTVPAAEHRSKAASLLKTLQIERPDALVEQLSIGQQQRVAVARAVACNPVLVLADEPTASLDPRNAAGAMELIQSICRERGAALLCVSHDPSMTSRFSRVEHLNAVAEASR